MKKIKKVKLFVNNNEKSSLVADKLKIELESNGFKIVSHGFDLGISIGGDGSFLRMLKENRFDSSIYYIGINSGTLGFLQEINIDETEDFVKRLKNSDYKIEKLSVQSTKIISEHKTECFESLNEIVLRNIEFNTLKLPIYVDDELLEQFTGDGILISTSTGSTAYNMSFGGSIVYNTLSTLQISPIAPLNNKIFHTLNNSVIIPGDKEIIIKPDKEYDDLFLSVDGVNYEIKDAIKLVTKLGRKKINCIRMNDFHFIKVVNNKILEKE